MNDLEKNMDFDGYDPDEDPVDIEELFEYEKSYKEYQKTGKVTQNV